MATDMQMKKTRGRPRSTSSGKQASTVQSLDRALSLLNDLAEMDEATLKELALRTGMAPSTAHRFLMTMQRHGIVTFDEITQSWMIGVTTYQIGSSFVRRTNIVETSRPFMRELMEATGETANLAIAADGEVVFISQVETHEPIRAFFPPGKRGQMHASGVGKALLSEFSDDTVQRIMQKHGLPSFTPNTITSFKDLFDDLEQIRVRGWAIDNEERNIGMRCLAAAIYNGHGEAVAGISISGPSVRMTDEVLGEFGPQVKRIAARITQTVGGTTPS